MKKIFVSHSQIISESYAEESFWKKNIAWMAVLSLPPDVNSAPTETVLHSAAPQGIRMDPLSSHVHVYLETVNLFWKGVSQSCPGYIKNLFFLILKNLWNTDLGFMKKAELLSSRNLHCSCVVFVQLFSHVWLFVTPWTAACQAYLSFTISWSLLKLMPIELVMPFQLSHPLSPPSSNKQY